MSVIIINDIDVDPKACCFVLTAPITLPLAGIGWCCWKLYMLFYGKAVNKEIVRLESQLPFTDNMWRGKNMLLGWQVGNTFYIALDVRECSSPMIVSHIEKNYDSKRSYVFLLVDALKIDTWNVHMVMQGVHGKSSVSVYSLAKGRQIINLENYMINVPEYYGLLGNLFRIGYY